MVKIFISKSSTDSEEDVEQSRKGSGNRGAGDGQRMPRQENNGDLWDETVEDFLHRKKKRNKKPKRDLALPHSGTDAQDPGSARDVHVKREIWEGRHERDSAPPKERMIIGGPKGVL